MAEDSTKTKTTKKSQSKTDQEQSQVDQVEAVTPEQNEVVKADQANEIKTQASAAAKAGKRSKRAIEEEAEKEAKEVKKTQAKTSARAEAKKPKHVQNPKRIVKKRRDALAKLEAGKQYGLAEGVKLLREVSTVKFDATCELHINLGIDPRQADQLVRTSVVLPAGTGKKIRLAVIAGDKPAAAAKAAGAELTNAEDILNDIKKSKFDFDVLVATPDQMASLGKFAKVLGPKGLMPSPKSGTVTADPATAVKEIKAGRAEVKNDANGIIHVGFGKLSFKDEALLENAKALINAVYRAKPSGLKGTYVKSITIASTMSPGIRLDVNAVHGELR